MNYYIILGIPFIIIACIIVFLLFFNKSGSSVASVSTDGPFPLSAKTSVVKSSDFSSAAQSQHFLTEGTGTFQAYVYLDSLSQTSSVSSCGTRPSQPSCTTGLYDPCTCTSSVDCTNCSHDGYKNLVSMYGVYNLEILPFPDASRQNTVSTQLSVQTQTASQTFIETIPLPPIRLQKWVYITISKVGRRVDVYYNDSLVTSTTLLNMISTTNSSGSIVQAGDSGLSGSIGIISMNDSTSTIGSVAGKYSQISDTRGAPSKFAISLQSYTNTVNPVSTSGVLSALCLDGSCLNLPRVGNVSTSLSQFADNLNSLSNTASSNVISPAFNVETNYA